MSHTSRDRDQFGVDFNDFSTIWRLCNPSGDQSAIQAGAERIQPMNGVTDLAQLISLYGDIAVTYHQLLAPQARIAASVLPDAFARAHWLASPKTIVDLFSGSGVTTTAPLNSIFKSVLPDHYRGQSKIIGVDATPQMIAQARSLLPRVDFGTPVEFHHSTAIDWLRTAEKTKFRADAYVSISGLSVHIATNQFAEHLNLMFETLAPHGVIIFDEMFQRWGPQHHKLRNTILDQLARAHNANVNRYIYDKNPQIGYVDMVMIQKN